MAPLSSQVVLNADDFGRSASINAAVLQAHEYGVLTSASLMVAGDAVDEAVAIARSHPDLAVGLHVVVVAGRAVSPPERIPHLVTPDGHFSSDAVGAGLRYAFDRATRRELAAEIRAQFERFGATGLPMAHVDGHVHMHIHPAVLGLILPLAVEFGARRIRLPRDDLGLSLAVDKKRLSFKVLNAAVFDLMCLWSLRRIRKTPLAVTGRCYGLMQTGNMHERYVVEVLRRLSVPRAELYFHPAVEAEFEADGPNPNDLATLLSLAVRQVIAERGLQPVGMFSKT
jgi:chitin disaccharide deacetylase